MAKKQYEAKYRIRGLAERGDTVELEEKEARSLLRDGIIVEKQAAGKEDTPSADDQIRTGFPGGKKLRDKFPTYGDVAAASDEELMNIKGLGEATVQEIRGLLGEYGIEA